MFAAGTVGGGPNIANLVGLWWLAAIGFLIGATVWLGRRGRSDGGRR